MTKPATGKTIKWANKRHLLSGPYLIWVIGFILLPLAVIVYYAFTTSEGTLTAENVLAIASPIHAKALLLALQLALICTAICLILSYPLAMILRNLGTTSQSFIVFLFILPMWMNFMLRILAWKMLLSNNGVINQVLSTLHLPRQNIINTPTAVVFCMVYDFLPFMILPLYNSMTRIGNDVIEAARDLGAGSLTVFFKVIVPLTLSGVISGIIMVFVPALTSFAISDLLGGGKVLLIGNVIEHSFMQEYNWSLGSGLSFVLMLFVVASMVIAGSFDKEGGGTKVW
ncbi:ABC transporter permease [Clostridia bacterium]|nr:ABC transporter permease [Clostridia bacterium]